MCSEAMDKAPSKLRNVFKHHPSRHKSAIDPVVTTCGARKCWELNLAVPLNRSCVKSDDDDVTGDFASFELSPQILSLENGFGRLVRADYASLTTRRRYNGREVVCVDQAPLLNDRVRTQHPKISRGYFPMVQTSSI